MQLVQRSVRPRYSNLPTTWGSKSTSLAFFSLACYIVRGRIRRRPCAFGTWYNSLAWIRFRAKIRNSRSLAPGSLKWPHTGLTSGHSKKGNQMVNRQKISKQIKLSQFSTMKKRSRPQQLIFMKTFLTIASALRVGSIVRSLYRRFRIIADTYSNLKNYARRL